MAWHWSYHKVYQEDSAALGSEKFKDLPSLFLTLARFMKFQELKVTSSLGGQTKACASRHLRNWRRFFS